MQTLTDRLAYARAGLARAERDHSAEASEYWRPLIADIEQQMAEARYREEFSAALAVAFGVPIEGPAPALSPAERTSSVVGTGVSDKVAASYSLRSVPPNDLDFPGRGWAGHDEEDLPW